MPASFMTLFPGVLNSLEAMKVAIQTNSALIETGIRCASLGFDLVENAREWGFKVTRRSVPLFGPAKQKRYDQVFDICEQALKSFLSVIRENLSEYWGHLHQQRLGELEFIELFIEKGPQQDWKVEYDDTNIILDLPSLRVIDISADVRHKIRNYGVVFAPRAGHHSNIAERVALYMRDHGLTRMAVVEQKCAQDIPLYVDGERHYEAFEGQVEQYRKVLEHFRLLTGSPPHLIGICQPGPLLMSTLILNPHLGKTFGSAGAPMHTEGERGYLTDFGRMVGEVYIERIVALLGHTISEEHVGAGRESFDGRLQVLGFYFLGMDQHLRNLKELLSDFQRGDKEAAERQKSFYQWYNYVHHFPVGFVRDTFTKIFIKNALIHGTLTIGGKQIGIKDYPGSVPIWAIGGTKDNITPPLQATGHMPLIRSVSSENKLTLICEAGHMGLFRSDKILKNYYNKIVEFILSHSDKTTE